MSEKKMSFEEFSELVDNSDLSLDHMADMLAEEMKKAPKREPMPVQRVTFDDKWINEQIYENGVRVRLTNSRFMKNLEKKKLERMRMLFGLEKGHEYDLYDVHEGGSDYIGDILILDAIRTGKRDDLPDVLIPEYDRRVSML